MTCMPVSCPKKSQEKGFEELKLMLQWSNKFTLVNARAKTVSKRMVLENFWLAMCGRLSNDGARRL